MLCSQFIYIWGLLKLVDRAFDTKQTKLQKLVNEKLLNKLKTK